jgi:hypothetical protein
MEASTLDAVNILPPWLPLQLSRPVLALAVVGLVLLGVWRRIQPKPLPGIPFNQDVGVWGDLPRMTAYRKEGRGFRRWFGDMARKHNSPIVQLIWPFGRPPSIILVDYQEARDIQLHRHKEFDRGKVHVEVFGTIVPNHHISMRSTNPQYKSNRELVRDLMTPAFLNEVR